MKILCKYCNKEHFKAARCLIKETEINKIKNEFEFNLKSENITFNYIPNPINTNYN